MKQLLWLFTTHDCVFADCVSCCFPPNTRNTCYIICITCNGIIPHITFTREEDQMQKLHFPHILRKQNIYGRIERVVQRKEKNKTELFTFNKPTQRLKNELACNHSSKTFRLIAASRRKSMPNPTSPRPINAEWLSEGLFNPMA
uniref:Uncharacterized protein n=1 Tax=Schistocephalus solidus TaxID=70667 RepID=A0A0V0J4B4_SCHSO